MMKRTLICVVLSAGMVAMPIAANAHDYHGYRGYRGYYGHGGHGDFHGDGFVHALALPLIAGAAVLGAVATIASAPFEGPPQQVYYGPPRAYGYAPAPVPYGYGAPPVYAPAYGYAPPPAYGYAPQVCTYYPNGARYCR